MDIGVVALIVLVILGTGILWLSGKEGSFAWKWKNRFLGEISSTATGKQSPDQVQIQEGGTHNQQESVKEAKSHQKQVGGDHNKQTIK